MKEQQTPMLQRNAAVANLNQVPGFDPVKLLHEQVSKRAVVPGELPRLSLRYKKLWFRLACPRGRVRLNALRVTDQLAIIEAQVYLHKDDPTPVSNFTAERTVQESPRYIEAAQYEAMDNALTDAGFGIQLCDVCAVTGEEAYKPREAADHASLTVSEPVKPAAADQEQTAPKQPAPEEAVPPTPAMKEPPAVEQTPDQAPVKTPPPVQQVEMEPQPTEQFVQPVQQPVQVTEPQPAPVQQPAQSEADQQTTEQDRSVPSAPVQVTGTPAPADQEPQVSGGYSPSLSVEENTARMSLEEARSIVADVGMCRGQTLGQIAANRPASLRWYLMGCKEASSVLKAGAQIVLNSLAQQKAA